MFCTVYACVVTASRHEKPSARSRSSIFATTNLTFSRMPSGVVSSGRTMRARPVSPPSLDSPPPAVMKLPRVLPAAAGTVYEKACITGSAGAPYMGTTLVRATGFTGSAPPW